MRFQNSWFSGNSTDLFWETSTNSCFHGKVMKLLYLFFFKFYDLPFETCDARKGHGCTEMTNGYTWFSQPMAVLDFMSLKLPETTKSPLVISCTYIALQFIGF